MFCFEIYRLMNNSDKSRCVCVCVCVCVSCVHSSALFWDIRAQEKKNMIAVLYWNHNYTTTFPASLALIGSHPSGLVKNGSSVYSMQTVEMDIHTKFILLPWNLLHCFLPRRLYYAMFVCLRVRMRMYVYVHVCECVLCICERAYTFAKCFHWFCSMIFFASNSRNYCNIFFK